jgi:cyclophilin family peptidyl-prolyl cis-trans isomerase
MRRVRPAETQAALLLGLAKLRPVPIAPVLAALGSQEPSVVRAAAYVIGRNRLPQGVRTLLTVRTHPDEEVRASVARALTKATVGDSLDLSARMALQQLLRDGNERVRANAARSAATFREQLAEDVLMRMWDPAANVRVAAAEVAAEAFGRDTIRWKRAWNADTLLRVRRLLLEQARALNLGLFPDVERQWATRADWRYRAASMGADQAPSGGVAIDVAVARTLVTDPDPRVRRIASQRVGTLARDTTRLPPERERPLAEYEELVRRAWGPGDRPLLATLTTGEGAMTIELFPRDAPLVVEAFQRLAQSGRYDNIVFHRVVPNFVAQTGDVTPDGSGRAEFRLRESYTRRRHGRGCLGLATSGPDTGGSQFYFCHASQPHLDGAYTVFGRVIRGLDVMDRIVQGDRLLRVAVP